MISTRGLRMSIDSEPITWLLPVANFFSLADVFGAGFFETGLRARDTMMSGLPLDADRTGFHHAQAIAIKAHNGSRSDERRVGKACVSTCRSRWSLYH